METQKRIHSISREEDFRCEKASNSTAGEYRTASLPGVSFAPRAKRSMSQMPYLSILKAGLNPPVYVSGRCQGPKREVNGGLSIWQKFPYCLLPWMGWSISLSLRSICASRLD